MSGDQRAQYKSLAQKGAADADTWEAKLSDVEKGLWAVESNYQPAKFSNAEAIRIEGRMDVLRSEISRTKDMITQIRIKADRIERQT